MEVDRPLFWEAKARVIVSLLGRNVCSSKHELQLGGMACSYSNNKLFFFVFTALITGTVASGAVKYNVTVNNQDGHDNNSCLVNSSFHCKSIGFVLRNMKNSTQVLIEQPLADEPYVLEDNYTLEYFHDIGFTGGKTNNTRVNIKCGNGVGWTFHFCEGITFDFLNFSNCGRLQKSAPFDAFNQSKNFSAGIFLAYCRDFAMVNCYIFGSIGKGLVMYDVGGIVNFTGSTFENNTSPNASETDYITSAGGVSIHFTQHGGLPPFDATNQIQLKYNTNNTYYFTKCHFRHNCYTGHNTDEATPFDYGGGLSIFFRGVAQNNTFLLDGCDFISNSALWGAGIFTTFYNNAQENLLEIKNCVIKDNEARFAGGGVRSGSEIDGRKTLKENQIRYENVMFVSNKAIFGGGLSHYGWPYLPVDKMDSQRSLLLNQCTFDGNSATIGSAMGVVLNKHYEFGVGALPTLPFLVTIENSFFNNNSIIRTEDKVVVGQGALYSSNTPIVLRKGNVFINNSKTALLLDNADVKIYDFAEFYQNHGINGGAIALYGQSRIITTNGSQLKFERNHVNLKGGAIYVRAAGPAIAAFWTRLLDRHQCFLAYEDDTGFVDIEHVESWNTKLYFFNNSAAPFGGNSVFASSLQSCFRNGERRLDNEALSWKNITYYTADIGTEISTDPVKIEINKTDWTVAASEVFDASVNLLDEKGNPVYGIVRIDVHGTISERNVSLDLPSDLFLVDVHNVNGESKVHKLKLKGAESSEFVVEIFNLDGQTVNSKPEEVTLLSCNPGFSPKDGKCRCSKSSASWKEGMSHCDSDGKTFYLKTGYWGGNVTNKFTTLPCPPNYCSPRTQYYNSSLGYFKYDKASMCAGNRSSDSVLCGECKGGYSVNVGNENCTLNQECSSNLNWQIPVFIIVIPIIVLIILRINIDIFTSYLNSWLYFYQVVQHLNNEGSTFDPVMNGIIKLVNMQIPGVGPCLFQDFNNLQKVGLNYLIPGSILVCLIIIVRIAKLRRCHNWYVNRNVFRAVCTLLVLCYTNITTISFNIIHTIPVHGVWILYIDGDIWLTSHWNATLGVLFTLAVVSLLLFVLLFPLMLMFRPWFIHHCHCLSFLGPLIDIFQNCFHARFGAFAAYYFICRIAIIIVDLFVFSGPFKRCFLEGLTILILLCFVFFKPYRPATEHNQQDYTWLNTVDTVILAILCAITIMASAQTGDAAYLTRHGLNILVNVLAWLPMVYLVGLIVYALKCYYRDRQHRPGYQDLEEPTGTSHSDSKAEPRAHSA